MPRNGSGTFVPPTNSWNPAVNGTPIQSSAWAAQLSDIANGLSQSLSSDGQTTASVTIPFAQGVKVNNGTVSTPSVTFISDTDTGLYRVAANTAGITAGGVLALSASSTVVTIPVNLAVTGTTTFTGAVTFTTPIVLPDGSITNAKLANVPTATFKGRITAAAGVPEDLTVTQATSLLNAVVGDAGAGGTKGLVPAPATGDAALKKTLGADGAWGFGEVIAWGVFAGDTGATVKSRNLSCVRNSTGDYSFTLATAAADANYFVTGTGSDTAPDAYNPAVFSRTINGFSMTTGRAGAASYDPVQLLVLVIG